MEHGTCKPIRHQPELQDSCIRLSIPRFHDYSDGCFPLQLGSSRTFRLPSFRYDQATSLQASVITEDVHHPHYTVLAAQRMVSGSAESDGRRSPTTNTTKPAEAASLPSLPEWSPRASANRVETIRQKGYSRRFAKFPVSFQRYSTLVNYQYKWICYRMWCHWEGHTTSEPFIEKFVDFLVHLHQDCHLSISAIKGYKAMIDSVFRLEGVDLSSDPVLQEVIRACSRGPRRPRLTVPPWNVDVVLRHLVNTPFKPLEHSSLRLLTQKTLFLVALASAKKGEQTSGVVFTSRFTEQ